MKLTCVVAAAVCLMFAGAARADTISNLTLNSTMGNPNGTGMIDTSGALNSTGTTVFSTNTHRNSDILQGLSFTIDGQTFDLER